MSNIKLVHSGGNSVSLTTPDSNPAANRTFKLPGADGSAEQVLKTDGSGALSFATPVTWITAASFDCASATPSDLVATGLTNPQVIMYVLHEMRHSASSRCIMRIGSSGGYQTGGYFDIGYYVQAGGTPTRTRGHNQGQWYPLDYNFTNATNQYSGKIVLTRTFNRWSYETSCDVSYSSQNTQYDIGWRGHNRDFSSSLDRVNMYNDGGGTFNSGYVTILTQS